MLSFHFPFQFLRISHPIIDFIHLDLLFINRMSVIKGYNNQEIILSNFDFPVENYSGPLVTRNKKQGNFIKSFSLQCQLEVAPATSLWGSCVWYAEQGEAKCMRTNGKCLQWSCTDLSKYGLNLATHFYTHTQFIHTKKVRMKAFRKE